MFFELVYLLTVLWCFWALEQRFVVLPRNNLAVLLAEFRQWSADSGNVLDSQAALDRDPGGLTQERGR